jgi:hypothetical protein
VFLGYLTLTGTVFGAHVLSGQASQPGSQAADRWERSNKEYLSTKNVSKYVDKEKRFFVLRHPSPGTGEYYEKRDAKLSLS